MVEDALKCHYAILFVRNYLLFLASTCVAFHNTSRAMWIVDSFPFLPMLKKLVSHGINMAYF